MRWREQVSGQVLDFAAAAPTRLTVAARRPSEVRRVACRTRHARRPATLWSRVARRSGAARRWRCLARPSRLSARSHWRRRHCANLGSCSFDAISVARLRDFAMCPRRRCRAGHWPCCTRQSWPRTCYSLCACWWVSSRRPSPAFGLGLAIGRFARASVLLPPLELLRPIPAVAWIPLAILMFPSSEMSMVFITFIGALFPDPAQHHPRRRRRRSPPGRRGAQPRHRPLAAVHAR